MKKKSIIFIFLFLVALSLIIFRYDQANKPVKAVSFQTIKTEKANEIKAKNGIHLHIEKVSQFKKDGVDYYKILFAALNESNNETEINTNDMYLSYNSFSTSFLAGGVNSLQENEEVEFGTRIHLGPQKTGKYEFAVPIFPKSYSNTEQSKDIYLNYKVIDAKSNSKVEYKIKL
jgi:hypothetical protein